MHGISWGLITDISITTHPPFHASYLFPESTHCPNHRNSDYRPCSRHTCSHPAGCGMTIWTIRRRRWEAKAAIYFLGTILVDFLESLLREYFGAWHIWVITAAGLMEMGRSHGNLHKVYSWRTFSALKFLSDLGLWCWPEGNVGTRTALFYLRLLSVGIFQVKNRSKHSGLLVNSLKNAIYLGKQMYKWN